MGWFSGIVDSIFGGGGTSSQSSTSSTTNNQDNRVVASDGSLVVGQNGYVYQDSGVRLVDSGNTTSFYSLTDAANRSVNTSVSDNDSTSYAYAWADSSNRSVNNSGNSSSAYNVSTNTSTNTSTDDRDAYSYDSSNRSTTNTTTTVYNTGTDGGAVKIAELNADFLQAIGESQLDSVKAIGAQGAESLRNMGELLSNSYEVAGSNNTKAWSATLDASSALVDKLLTQAGKTTDSARAVAESAITAFQPTENKSSDTTKWIGLAAVGVVGLLLLRKA